MISKSCPDLNPSNVRSEMFKHDQQLDQSQFSKMRSSTVLFRLGKRGRDGDLYTIN